MGCSSSDMTPQRAKFNRFLDDANQIHELGRFGGINSGFHVTGIDSLAYHLQHDRDGRHGLLLLTSRPACTLRNDVIVSFSEYTLSECF